MRERAGGYHSWDCQRPSNLCKQYRPAAVAFEIFFNFFDYLPAFFIFTAPFVYWLRPGIVSDGIPRKSIDNLARKADKKCRPERYAGNGGQETGQYGRIHSLYGSPQKNK